jgi:copper chaperone CopZ
MTVATKSSRTLQIDGMSGEDCCKKVTGALKGVSNVATHNVKVGTAHIEADDAGCKDACKAIDGAGFKAHETQKQNGQKQEKPGVAEAGTKTDQVGPKGEHKNQPAAQTGAAAKPASSTR